MDKWTSLYCESVTLSGQIRHHDDDIVSIVTLLFGDCGGATRGNIMAIPSLLPRRSLRWIQNWRLGWVKHALILASSTQYSVA